MRTEEWTGLWPLPRKDAGNTARCELRGNMTAAPREVWRYGGGGSYRYVNEVMVNGARHFLDTDLMVFFLKRDNRTAAGSEDLARDIDLLRRSHRNLGLCGRDEVVVGYWALSAEGKLLWRVEHGDDISMHDHSDSRIAGEFDGNVENGPEVAVVGGDFYLMSARDGRVRARSQVGHIQGLSVGNFRPDLPGLEILCATRWDNYGILAVFSGSGELLARFHPDNVSQGGAAINWTGDGGELIFLQSTREAFGMYDGYGRKVVVFPEDEGFPAGDYYSFWDGQAMNIDLVGDARDEVVIVKDGAIHIYTQDRPFPKGERIYAPVRKHGQQVGNPISTPGWKINDA